ncbi:MAG: hypothetical protein IJT24_02550 [Lachnospiraceae bacterium]|nr:hypothetical protein [Lachnospiraceae bacterium]
MQDLNIADAGFGYIFKCIGAYYEGNIYFLLYVIALAFLSLAGSGKGEKAGRLREIFLPQFIMMALTVYNPVFPVVLNSLFDVNKEYYRFLWMSPVIICIAAAGAVIVYDFAMGEKIREELKGSQAGDNNDSGEKSGDDDTRSKTDRGLHKSKTAVRAAVSVVFIICLLTAGGTFLYRDGYIVSPNEYHMPTEIPEIAELIHEDAGIRYYINSDDDPEEAVPEQGNDYPRAMFEYDYQMQIRQYDAGILLSCDREQYLRALSGEVTYDTAVEDGNYTDSLLAVVALGIEVPEDDFISAMEHTGTEYVVITTANGMLPYYEEAGLTVVGETANHTVLHYEAEEPVRFLLPDYTEVWRLTPQWYDFLM